MRYVNLDSLYEEIGIELELEQRDFEEKYSIKPGTDGSIIRAGRIEAAKRFLSQRYSSIHAAICSDAERRERLLQSDEASVAIVLADCIAPIVGGLPVFTIANLLARIGIKRICLGDPFGD